MVMTRDVVWMAAVWALATSVVPRGAGAETLEHGLAALKLGSETMALPQLDEALRIFIARAAAADPAGEAHYHLARTHEALALYHVDRGDTASAARHLERGITAAKIAVDRNRDASAHSTVLGNLYGLLTAQSGVVGKMRYGRLAASAFATALRLDARNPLAHVGAGIGKLETPAMFGGSVVEALAEFRRAQALDPTCTEAWIWEGIAQRRLGEIPDARRAFTKALAVNPRSAHARRELAALEEDF